MRLLIHHVNYSGCIFLKAEISIHDTEHDFNPLTSKQSVNSWKYTGVQGDLSPKMHTRTP